MTVSLLAVFFFNDTATTEIYTLSLHDALPIWRRQGLGVGARDWIVDVVRRHGAAEITERSEEHTSELQSRLHLVCRLLLEKKKKNKSTTHTHSRTMNIQTSATLATASYIDYAA